MPDDFITIAENSGLIVPLGMLVLDEVCSQISRWRSLGESAPHAPISLNISPRQLTETDFVQVLTAKMDEWQIAPDNLILEITETALIRDPLKSRRAMEQLRELGLRLCLDDFGTGWSSLRHLSTFPVHEIKIDRSFVSRVLPGNTEFEIVRSLTALAHTLGLAVTGEGVEHGDQLGLLEKMGCDNAQGFFIGRPMFPDRLTEFLEQYRYGVPFVGETESGPVPAGVTCARGGLQTAADDPALGPLVGRLVPGS
jgi:EAL domain-containing protein (putative c-di-GMP-specific phosphodiesterase class I)